MDQIIRIGIYLLVLITPHCQRSYQDCSKILKPPPGLEMARLNISNSVTSKRKVKRLIDEGVVGGWDDPRLTTLAGIKRRGIPAQASRRDDVHPDRRTGGHERQGREEADGQGSVRAAT